MTKFNRKDKVFGNYFVSRSVWTILHKVLFALIWCYGLMINYLLIYNTHTQSHSSTLMDYQKRQVKRTETKKYLFVIWFNCDCSPTVTTVQTITTVLTVVTVQMLTENNCKIKLFNISKRHLNMTVGSQLFAINDLDLI